MNEWKCAVCGTPASGKEPPDRCPVCGAGKYRFIIDTPPPPDLERMLKTAFAAESKAHVRNLAFARKAKSEGFSEIADLFSAVAEAERVHAEEFLKYLVGVIGSTEENLKTAFEHEIKAAAEGYTPFIKEALTLKREDVAWSFSRARDVENRHAKLYKAALSALAVERNIQYHVCQVCGYVFDGPLPDQCPVCRTRQENFKKIDSI